MPNLEWKTRRNLEDSLKEFLESQISTSSLTAFHEGNNVPIHVRVGFPTDSSWTLPVISEYVDNKTSERFLVGSNKRYKNWLMILEIRALDDGMRMDLAEWVAETINEGFPYYEYAPNGASPNSPTKTLAGNVNVEFLSDLPVRLPNVDKIDLFRHRITISVEIN